MPKTPLAPFNLRIHELRHQAVRDLAWCCFSAPLLQKLPDSDAMILPINNDQLWPWLIALDRQPDALLDQLAQLKSTRLGIYYEMLWRFYFTHQPEWELLHHNLQVQRSGVTLGAFDFLCRRGSEYWHIETAVKFYLCDANNADEALNWNHWIGPNSEDRLDLKLTHLRQHQLPLHQSPEARAQLHALYPDAGEWHTGLCIQGYLFSPVASHYRPALSTDNHGKGYWWHLQDFLKYQREHNDIQWIIPERRDWLSPIHVNNSDLVQQRENATQQLEDCLEKMNRPLLIAALKKMSPEDQYWQETWRGFVVPDHWPQQE